ncbi:nicotinate phosphoribosyltransferase [Algoriphagus sp. CAU 1675]|uniref:nicotinate phosphoribosyltransferase n=1 Tax=Algoriphagus sp. CAU 1675 TaxID=3032597 RepID=UPI0023DC95C5|nr:nicotinate phosphoribosyltransferase [Algoriphagus sp. CAU 1675]MDF2159275.1 nicotinate phosphoribosyltransferase [Algoriphagus sp. CAU 1675]
MRITKDLYRGSLALLTDFYQLTMAYGYWKSGKAEQEVVFNLFFRKHPFHGGFTLAAGLEYVVDYCRNFRFTKDDLEYLRTMKGKEGEQLFEEEFLKYLEQMKFSCDVDAVEEGTAVFPNMPLIRVKGPLIQCQLLETPFLNITNFQTLIATKAARINLAAHGEPILEFGLRRAQGIDGALAASRASYLGGCSSTSNVLAGKLFGIPVSGTHAHSWIMSFETELKAFEAYAEVFPDHCIFLVDTYDTINGIRNAIKVGKILREKGKEMIGIRIDSGDLAYFSNQARIMLDEAGFPDAKVVASGDLDEYLIDSLEGQEASIDIWGVGTKLVTAFDQPALGAVYKLSAVRNENGEWEPKLKLSEQSLKINIPGYHTVKRYYSKGKAVADMIYLEGAKINPRGVVIIDPNDQTKRKRLMPEFYQEENLLIPIFRKGKMVYKLPDLEKIKERANKQIEALDKTHKRFVNPHIYPVGLEENLHHLRMDLVMKAKKFDEENGKS